MKVTRAVSERTAGTEPPPPAQADGTGRRPPGRGFSYRPLLLRLHFYAGMFVAPFLLVAALTGLLYTTMPTLEKIVYKDQLTVTPAGKPLSLARQVQAARSAYPDGAIALVRPSYSPTTTTRVQIADPALGEDYSRTVYVNPYSGEVIAGYRTYGDAPPLRTFSTQLHRSLLLGNPGRFYSELAASWLWVIALGGLALWIGRRKRSLRRMLRPDRNATGRRRLVSWHGVIGTLIVIGLVGLSITGLTWSQKAGDNVTSLRSSMSWQTPAVDTGPSAEAGGEHAQHGGAAGGGAPGTEAERVIELDRVVAAAGFSGPTEVLFPSAPEGKFAVRENNRGWPARADSVAVDGRTGEVTDRLAFADWPLMAKAARWGIYAHMGLLFGIVNQIVLAAVAIGLIGMIVLGYRMWWKRRPTRNSFGGRPFPRGTWRYVSAPELLALALVTAFVGWFVPLLGISLLAFLVLDAVIGAGRRPPPKARGAGG